MPDQREALGRMAAEDPELAARLVLMTLPAAAAKIPGTLAYDVELDGLGAWRVSVVAARGRVLQRRATLVRPETPSPDAERQANESSRKSAEWEVDAVAVAWRCLERRRW